MHPKRQREILAFAMSQKLAVISTVTMNGAPQSALVGIAVTPDLEIIFDTLKSSRKYANILATPAVALVIGCTDEKTLQYEGVAAEITGSNLERYQPIYFAAFPNGPQRLNWEGICYVMVKPKWLRFSDYTQSPALIEECHFPT